MTEQLTRKQLRAARQAGSATPVAPTAVDVAGDDASAVASVPVTIDSSREFQLSGPIEPQPHSDPKPPVFGTETSSGAGVGEASLSPDELLRNFRERIRSGYPEGSMPIPQAKLPERVTNPTIENYSFDIDAIRERLRAAADAARLQSQAGSAQDQLQDPVQHESEPIREISEFDIAARQSATTLHVEALRESFAGSGDGWQNSLDATSTVSPGIVESPVATIDSRRSLRRLARRDQIAAPFSEEAESGLGLEVGAEAEAAVELKTESRFGTIELDNRVEQNDASVEPANFVGKNLLAEPSTQSIVLDVIPDAVTMPINMSADGLTTGSISIIPEQSVSDVTGAIAGIKTDESTLKDTVTGAVSVIEPVSALAVIAERRHHAVLPMTSLRRGWWQPYAVAVGIFAMIGAAAYAVFLILEVLNS